MNQIEIELFWYRVDKRGQHHCWCWTSGVNSDGYGQLVTTITKCGVGLAHRVAWTICRGRIPPGMCVLHKCDNPPCVNPSHLYIGSRTDNAKDKVQRGRVPSGGECSWSKLSTKKVATIRRRWNSGRITQLKMAAQFGVDPSMISMIVNNKSWRNHK